MKQIGVKWVFKFKKRLPKKEVKLGHVKTQNSFEDIRRLRIRLLSVEN